MQALLVYGELEITWCCMKPSDWKGSGLVHLSKEACRRVSDFSLSPKQKMPSFLSKNKLIMNQRHGNFMLMNKLCPYVFPVPSSIPSPHPFILLVKRKSCSANINRMLWSNNNLLLHPNQGLNENTKPWLWSWFATLVWSMILVLASEVTDLE